MYGLKHRKEGSTYHISWEKGRENFCFSFREKKTKKFSKTTRVDELDPSLKSVQTDPDQYS